MLGGLTAFLLAVLVVTGLYLAQYYNPTPTGAHDSVLYLITRVVVLALDTDSATVFAATVLRDHAPDLPILAGVSLAENVARVQRAGVDYALSVSQVAGQLLAHHALGETVSLQPRIKLVRVDAGRLAGKNPMAERIRERTGCTVVAVERDGQVAMDFPTSLRLSPDDALYICGTTDAVARYNEEFPTSRP